MRSESLHALMNLTSCTLCAVYVVSSRHRTMRDGELPTELQWAPLLPNLDPGNPLAFKFRPTFSPTLRARTPPAAPLWREKEGAAV